MDILTFQGFEIHTARRQVRVHGVPMPLGARAFDLLMLLVEKRERVVTKAEIFASVWPGQIVEDNNLTVQVSALRRSLGAEAIVTVSGRGYRFVAEPVQEGAGATKPAAGNLPLRSPVVYGRERELAELLQAHETRACVTLCGLAGVGKTTLAICAARQMAAARPMPTGSGKSNWPTSLTRTSLCRRFAMRSASRSTREMLR